MDSSDRNVIQSRAMRCFLWHLRGTWDGSQVLSSRVCEIVKLWNHFVRLSEEKLVKIIFNWKRIRNYCWAKDAAAIYFLFLTYIFVFLDYNLPQSRINTGSL